MITENNTLNIHQNGFTSLQKAIILITQSEKEIASRGKLNIHKANSTPLNRAFFVRSFRTPQENRLAVNQSMMACSGQSLRLAGLPCVPVFHPATRYRQAVESKAIAFEKLTQGLLAMIYRFKAISRFDLRRTNQPISSFPRYIVKINADTLDQAKAKVSPFFVVLEVNND